MPYIKPEKRMLLGFSEPPKTAGELNYCITQIINIYIKERGISYQTFNDIIGALEGAKLELYRRKIADYENEKIQQNGDVYE